MNIITVVGARPQFIKAATVSRITKNDPEINEKLVHTGQHYDFGMSDVFFDELEIPKPEFNLGIGSMSHGAQTARMLEAIENILLDTKPDCLLVYGDTNSTVAAALAAVKLHIPIAHVEAGVRYWNLKMPEEVNRLMTDGIADFLFAPTEAAVKNLRDENFSEDRIYNVGDVMYDAALFFAEKSKKHSTILDRLKIHDKKYILATIHRPSNTDDLTNLNSIFETLMNLSNDYEVVFPMHPRTKKCLEQNNLFEKVSSKIHVIDPVGYLDITMLINNSQLVVTDSGGLQKEAFFHGKSCVVVFKNTAWVELVDLGWNTLALPGNSSELENHIRSAIGKKGMPAKPYGDGNSAQKIVDILKQKLG